MERSQEDWFKIIFQITPNTVTSEIKNIKIMFTNIFCLNQKSRNPKTVLSVSILSLKNENAIFSFFVSYQ